jgi:hypothetical protein
MDKLLSDIIVRPCDDALFKAVGVRWEFLTEKQKKDKQEYTLKKENALKLAHLNVDRRVSTLMRKQDSQKKLTMFLATNGISRARQILLCYFILEKNSSTVVMDMLD